MVSWYMVMVIQMIDFNQVISSLAALVWGSDRGGPVGEAEKTGGRVCVADPKRKLEDLGSSPS